jgi:peptidoglycan/xylan/chitin deacetylase (PgdA/CDA1 family)
MPARRHRSGTLAALITAVAAAVPEALGAAGRTPRAAPGAASPEANLGRRGLCAASIALLPIIACACAGNNAAASPVASSQASPPQSPSSHSPRLLRHPRYRRPPQFVMISFDGSGDPALWRHWRAVGRRTGARFTFFVSGVYLLDRADARLYRPPHHSPGSSDIGFSASRADVRALVHQINLGYSEGHEIGTHYNGHFCEPYPGNVGTWTKFDWLHEIAQFHRLLNHAGVHLPDNEVQGGRTPCLQGRLDQLRSALRADEMSYDASAAGLPGTWPQRVHGIWSFPLALIKLVGTPWDSLSMDYNFYVNQSNATEVSPARAGVLEQDAYLSYLRYFRANYHGGRAPLEIGNHFATWNHGAYVRALTRFVDTVCVKPEVRCVTYSTLVDWLRSQPRRWLERDRDGRFTAMLLARSR